MAETTETGTETETETETESSAFYTALAREILRHYPRGPVTIAVTGPDADITRRVADAFAAAIDASGRTASRASGRGDADAEVAALKTDIVAPFRADGGDVLVVDGPQLLRPALRGSWNASVWLEGGPVLVGGPVLEGAALESERAYVRDDDPRGAATAVLSVADPELPTRVFSDSC